MVRIGIIGLALSDPHICTLSRDCFNLSREYFSLWAIKTSLDRNASAVLDPIACSAAVLFGSASAIVH